jgi:hypothetical protein
MTWFLVALLAMGVGALATWFGYQVAAQWILFGQRSRKRKEARR